MHGQCPTLSPVGAVACFFSSSKVESRNAEALLDGCVLHSLVQEDGDAHLVKFTKNFVRGVNQLSTSHFSAFRLNDFLEHIPSLSCADSLEAEFSRSMRRRGTAMRTTTRRTAMRTVTRRTATRRTATRRT